MTRARLLLLVALLVSGLVPAWVPRSTDTAVCTASPQCGVTFMAAAAVPGAAYRRRDKSATPAPVPTPTPARRNTYWEMCFEWVSLKVTGFMGAIGRGIGNFAASTWHGTLTFLRNSTRNILLVPIRTVYLYGPEALYCWNGKDPVDICAQITGESSANFRDDLTKLPNRRCLDRIDRHVWATQLLILMVLAAVCVFMLVRNILYYMFHVRPLSKTLLGRMAGDVRAFEQPNSYMTLPMDEVRGVRRILQTIAASPSFWRFQNVPQAAVEKSCRLLKNGPPKQKKRQRRSRRPRSPSVSSDTSSGSSNSDVMSIDE